MHIVSSNETALRHRELLAVLTPDTVLEALHGSSYVLGLDGTIKSFSLGHDIEQNSGHALDRGWSDIKGSNIFDHVRSTYVRYIYETIYLRIINRNDVAARFNYRCDSPTIERMMSMRITPVIEDGEINGLLHQSITLYENRRRPMAIFSPHKRIENHKALGSQPLLQICSFCHDVAYPLHGKSQSWITPEDYYIADGNEQVLVSFCACPSCRTHLAEAGSREIADVRRLEFQINKPSHRHLHQAEVTGQAVSGQDVG